MAGARGMAKALSKPDSLQAATAQSSRNRKRAAARAAKAVVEGDNNSPSGSVPPAFLLPLSGRSSYPPRDVDKMLTHHKSIF